MRLAVMSRDGQDLQVDIGAEATVQDELFVEIVVAPAQGGEIEKAEVHRLLDLISKAVGDEDPGDVGLDQLNRRGGLRIGRRLH